MNHAMLSRSVHQSGAMSLDLHKIGHCELILCCLRACMLMQCGMLHSMLRLPRKVCMVCI